MIDDEREHPLRVPRRDGLGDHPAHRRADDVRARRCRARRAARRRRRPCRRACSARASARGARSAERSAAGALERRAPDVAVVVADDEEAAGRGPRRSPRASRASGSRAPSRGARRVGGVAERLVGELDVPTLGRHLGHGGRAYPSPATDRVARVPLSARTRRAGAGARPARARRGPRARGPPRPATAARRAAAGGSSAPRRPGPRGRRGGRPRRRRSTARSRRGEGTPSR